MNISRYIGLGLLAILFLFKGHIDPYPKDLFRSPLKIPLRLSGNFAEMRSNHFHAGLDIKTNGREGYRVYAAADGWVSRIFVSPGGYGHALYINHPSGHTTVYAHLSRFNDAITAYVREQQYQQQRFRVDLYPEAGRFRVHQGEVIGYTGNSGSSGGPHLHFEIRDAATQEPLNPLLFGIPVEDTVPPRIYRIKVYALEPDGYARIEMTDGQVREVTAGQSATLEVVGAGRAYQLGGVRRLAGYGRLGFAIQTHDYHDGSNSRLGPYRIRLEADGRTLFVTEMERFSFDETRYINAHVDYAERQRNRRWFQRSFRLPGNRLTSIYRAPRNGILTVEPGATHRLLYTVEDAAGHAVQLGFAVTGMTARPAELTVREPAAFTLPFNRPATFERDGLMAAFPAHTVYEDVPLAFRVLPALPGAFSDRYVLHDEATPVHERYRLSLRADRLPARLRPKALIARVDEEGKWASEGGTYRNGFVTTRTRTFGTFFVAVDTLAPDITPLNIHDGKDLRGSDRIRLRIRDDLAGIDSYAGYVDGRWVLFAYDPKRDLIEYEFDDRVPPGPHTLSVVVTDQAGNTRRYEARFIR